MEQQIGGYLFAYFTGEWSPMGEQIYFAVSRDGLHWKDLNEAETPALVNPLGTGGARDPFLIRDPKGGYHLIATDLKIYEGEGWEASVTKGSRSLVIWDSPDLVHWSEARLVELAVPGAGCLWAPEAVYDEEREEFFVFFASMVKEEKDTEPKQRIYAARTRDFITFAPTVKYIERSMHVIDTTMIRDGKRWYRFSKNESTKRVDMEVADSLEGPFAPVSCRALEAMENIEGPEIYPMPDGGYCLIVDHFKEQGGGYRPMLIRDLAEGAFAEVTPGEYDMGITRKRHGGVLPLTHEEYEQVSTSYPAAGQTR